MRRILRPLAAAGLSLAAAAVFMGADHNDAPATKADHAADIADLYAWHDTTADSLVVVLTFAGLAAPGQPATYDPDVLYTINIDTNGDNTPDQSILVRFGTGTAGHHGVQVMGLPGSSAAIAGPVETVLSDGSSRMVFAGLRDDPFFFDLDGFKTTVQTGTLSFDHNHDTFAGTNVTAVVLRMKLSDAAAGSTHLSLWATTGRLAAPHGNASVEPRSDVHTALARNDR